MSCTSDCLLIEWHCWFFLFTPHHSSAVLGCNEIMFLFFLVPLSITVDGPLRMAHWHAAVLPQWCSSSNNNSGNSGNSGGGGGNSLEVSPAMSASFAGCSPADRQAHWEKSCHTGFDFNGTRVCSSNNLMSPDCLFPYWAAILPITENIFLWLWRSFRLSFSVPVCYVCMYPSCGAVVFLNHAHARLQIH